jgi:hypothetical protein
MSIALSNKVEDHEKRLAAIEQLLARPRSPLARCNMQRKAEGGRLRAAIEVIIAETPRATAKQVLKALASVDLGRGALPSVRTVQWHMTALKYRLSFVRDS